VVIAFNDSFFEIGIYLGVYLVEHQKQDANITDLCDAFWWAIVTIAMVESGDYYPVTAAGRLIAITTMMKSGTSVFGLLVGTLAQTRLRTESRSSLNLY
jgi:voltage-gated potassium channel